MAGKFRTIIKIGNRPAFTQFATIGGRGVRDTFSGKTTNPLYARAAASRIDIEIANMMIENIVENDISRSDKKDQGVMATAMRNAGQAEAAKLISFISRWMLNIEGNVSGVNPLKASYMMNGSVQKAASGGSGKRPLAGLVSWAGLRANYLKSKRDKRFFRRKGALAQDILSMQKSYPASLGGVTVDRMDFTKARSKELAKKMLVGAAKRRVLFGYIDIKIFPQADRGMLPGLQTGNWAEIDAKGRLERSGFFSAETSRKLLGPLGFKNQVDQGADSFRFRPMFGPVTQFWMLHRIPAAMTAALKKSSEARK